MKQTLGVLLIVFVLTASAQEVQVVKYDQVQKMLDASSDNVRVFNFWATWCGPCIKELPYFDKANDMENVEVFLVSLDFIQDEEKVKKFVSKKRLTSKVMLLNEKDYDSYMGKVNQNWSGAIPATLFVDTDGDKHFYEQPFSESELNEKIEEYSN